MYYPDVWVMLKFSDGQDSSYRVLASRYGGFSDGHLWKINSGVRLVEMDEHGYYLFHGYSGSIYRCHPSNYRLNGHTDYAYSQMKMAEVGQDKIKIELMSADTNFMKLLK